MVVTALQQFKKVFQGHGEKAWWIIMIRIIDIKFYQSEWTLD